jgi:hypothetical protein
MIISRKSSNVYFKRHRIANSTNCNCFRISTSAIDRWAIIHFSLKALSTLAHVLSKGAQFWLGGVSGSAVATATTLVGRHQELDVGRYGVSQPRTRPDTGEGKQESSLTIEATSTLTHTEDKKSNQLSGYPRRF